MRLWGFARRRDCWCSIGFYMSSPKLKNLTNRFLVHVERPTDRLERHPQLPHATSLRTDALIDERGVSEDRTNTVDAAAYVRWVETGEGEDPCPDFSE